jgi:hypothetical protein
MKEKADHGRLLSADADLNNGISIRVKTPRLIGERAAHLLDLSCICMTSLQDFLLDHEEVDEIRSQTTASLGLRRSIASLATPAHVVSFIGSGNYVRFFISAPELCVLSRQRGDYEVFCPKA